MTKTQELTKQNKKIKKIILCLCGYNYKNIEGGCCNKELMHSGCEKTTILPVSKDGKLWRN